MVVRAGDTGGTAPLTRQSLLDAAGRLLERGGRDATLSLRGVCREAGVAAPTFYWHFADLDTLVLELVRTHVDDLGQHLERAARRAGADPAGAVRAMALAYCRWGLEHPGPYTVVFEGAALRQLSAEDERALTGNDELLHTLAALLGALPRPPADPRLAATSLWTSLHGVVSLRLAKPAFRWPAMSRQVDEVLKVLLP